MGAKKKEDKKKKIDEGDFSTKELSISYKKICKEMEMPLYKPLDQKISFSLAENLNLNQILINDPDFGVTGIKSIFKALKSTK
jgi:hypothetical protein